MFFIQSEHVAPGALKPPCSKVTGINPPLVATSDLNSVNHRKEIITELSALRLLMNRVKVLCVFIVTIVVTLRAVQPLVTKF